MASMPSPNPVAQVRSFCKAEWDTADDQAVAAVLGGSLAIQALLGGLGELAGVHVTDVLHAEHHVRVEANHDWHEPVAARTTLGPRFRYGIGAGVEATCTLRDGDGRPVQSHRSVVTLPLAVDDQVGARRSRSAVPRRTDLLWATEWTPDQEFSSRYSDLSGDDNPIHLDPVAAHNAGLQGIILHGMSVLGFAVATAVQCKGADAALTGFGARFSRPVYPSKALTAEVWASDDPSTFRVQIASDGSQALRDCYVAMEPDDRQP